MTLYEKHLEKELNRWHRTIAKDSGLMADLAQQMRARTQLLVPRKIPAAIT